MCPRGECDKVRGYVARVKTGRQGVLIKSVVSNLRLLWSRVGGGHANSRIALSYSHRIKYSLHRRIFIPTTNLERYSQQRH